MDQLKPYLKVLQEHWFWFSCLAICLLTGVMWFLGTGSLKASFQTEYSRIKGKINEANTLASAQEHPNDQSREGMEALIADIKRSVRVAWHKQYDEQGEEIFVWPDGLRESFRNKVKDMRPIEALGFPPNRANTLNFEHRSEYANFIKAELPKLAKIVGARWAPTATTRGNDGAAGSNRPSAETAAPRNTQTTEEVVQWSAANQGAIQNERFDWSDANDRSPTTLELLYAQEDYWVLQALLQIISDTNQNAVSPQQKEVVIRRIDSIEIGKDARAEVGSIMRLSGQAAGPEGGGEGQGVPVGDMGPAPDDGMGGGGGAENVGPSTDPAHLRYVDKNYKRLSAEALRNARNSEEPDLAYLAVAKRMPVRLRLRMNQLAIPRLLVACANADLTVEVRQLRVNRKAAAGGANTSSSTPGNEQTSASVATDAAFPWDVDVEIYGIVYIYNPVDEEKLKFTAENEPGAAPGNPVTPPADPAAPPVDPAAPPVDPAAPPVDPAAEPVDPAAPPV
ncbi:hypothetical protein [Lignipirellula cremea]|uniref:Uncharacterized protein n=1 Tax=Lignipirellula cremea TaxID=2528010 RepID=A0A518DLQ0_9BACT|nr:hypothetical protein [Lignipirellula cremea]QDU92751.1 hypothetical protein Pla8534_05000 [Lignipirellula cremea]